MKRTESASSTRSLEQRPAVASSTPAARRRRQAPDRRAVEWLIDDVQGRTPVLPPVDAGYADLVASAALRAQGRDGQPTAHSPAPEDRVLAHIDATLDRPGQAIDAPTRAWMEPRFGRDFGAVRVHADPDAAATARAVGARAYTVGQHIVFGEGVPDVAHPAGRAVWAHELAHTVQQGPLGDRLQPLLVGPADDAFEREADRAARSVANGGTATLDPGSAATGIRRVQRAEHGTYISTLTEPASQQFLDNAAAYYRTWGYPNVRRIATIDDVLRDLDHARRHIDAFRIVAHANPYRLEVGLTSAIAKDEVGKEELGLSTAERFRPRFTSSKLVNDATYERELKVLRADSTTGPLLTEIGVPGTTPGQNEPLGILLRAILEADLVTSATQHDGSPLVIRHRAVLDSWNQQRIAQYRAVVEDAAHGQRIDVRHAITALIAAAPGALRKANLQWSFSQAQADEIGKDLLDPDKPRPALRPELAAAATEGAGQGSFLPRLARVRSRIDTATHIEIRGCNAGTDKQLLNSVRELFGSPGRLPSISAPDLYQAYFQPGAATYNPALPVDQRRLSSAWDDPATGLATAYDDAYRTRQGEMLRVVSDSKLAEVRARYQLAATERDLAELNPELDPGALQPGQIVWLVARQLPAGPNTSLEDFCASVLGNRRLWPKILAANDQWKRPPVLKPDDLVWLVPPRLRQRKASPARSLADFQADLQRGNAFGAVAPGNRFQLHIDHTRRAASAGAWFKRQGYDFQGRSAADLARQFAGGSASFFRAVTNHPGQFLTRGFPEVEDPIFPDDPRYAGHIIHLP